MSETKFTKGSWGVHVCGRDMEPMIANTEDGEPAFVFCERKVGAGDKIIADVHMRSSIDGHNLGYPSPDNMEEMLANTHLIAAAPELYETLDGLIGVTDRPSAPDYVRDAIRAANAALAKARGEA